MHESDSTLLLIVMCSMESGQKNNNSPMKRLFLLFIAVASMMIFASNANAQKINNEPIDPMSSIKWNGWTGYKNAAGEKIAKADITNYLDAYQYSDYKKGRSTFIAGISCVGTGIVCIAAGNLLGDHANASDDMDETLGAGMGALALIAPGVLLELAGLPCVFVGMGKMKKVAKKYNSGKVQPTLTMGAQQYGYGIAFNF